MGHVSNTNYTADEDRSFGVKSHLEIYVCLYCKARTRECHSWVCYPGAFIRTYCKNCDIKFNFEFDLENGRLIEAQSFLESSEGGEG